MGDKEKKVEGVFDMKKVYNVNVKMKIGIECYNEDFLDIVEEFSVDLHEFIKNYKYVKKVDTSLDRLVKKI